MQKKISKYSTRNEGYFAIRIISTYLEKRVGAIFLINIMKRQFKKYVKTGSDKEIDKAINEFLKHSKEMIEWIKK